MNDPSQAVRELRECFKSKCLFAQSINDAQEIREKSEAVIAELEAAVALVSLGKTLLEKKNAQLEAATKLANERDAARKAVAAWKNFARESCLDRDGFLTRGDLVRAYEAMEMEQSTDYCGYVKASELHPTIELLKTVVADFPEENEDIYKELTRLEALTKPNESRT